MRTTWETLGCSFYCWEEIGEGTEWAAEHTKKWYPHNCRCEQTKHAAERTKEGRERTKDQAERTKIKKTSSAKPCAIWRTDNFNCPSKRT